MDFLVVAVFLAVYAGMFLGTLPGLALDRSGIALLGAIALVAAGRLSIAEAWATIDISTIALLFGLMVISAQFRLSGFYSEVVRRIASATAGPERLLGWVVASAGGLSALLANDIVCFAMAPMLIETCVRRQLSPMPFLLALACASNVGSAATLIGNPQNMLIGQSLGLSFGGYLRNAGPPAALGLLATWGILSLQWRGRWHVREPLVADAARPPAYDPHQTAKGVVVLLLVVLAFLFTAWPREAVALGAAGVLLLSRRMASRDMIALVDWHLLVLFMGLFVVNDAVEQAGGLALMYERLAAAGIDLASPVALFIVTPVLSNLVSNVPAVMLLLPAATGPLAGPILALASTLAGNFLIVGSIANIIVVERAAQQGVALDWRTHVRAGAPITLVTLAIAAIWLALAA